MSLAVIGSSSAFLAIIPPKAEADWLADVGASRAGSIHSAVMIALVALFIVSWVLLSESPAEHQANKAAKGGLPR